MAYTPKTWVTKETITTAAMNNIEQGIAGAYTPAGTETAGIIKIATSANVQSGTGTNEAVNPADTFELVTSKIQVHNDSSDSHSNILSPIQQNVTTLRNDLDDLGDRVQGIQGTVNTISANYILLSQLTQQEWEELPAKNINTLYIVGEESEQKIYLGDIQLQKVAASE